MKRQKNSGKMWIIIVISLCLVFAAGIGAGTVISNMKHQKTKKMDSQNQGQNGSNRAKNDVAKKDGKGQPDDEKKVSSSTDSSKNSNSSGQDNKQASSQNVDSSGQANVQGKAESTYDASAPADDTAIHRYEYILSNATWQEAFQDCLSRGGYLARINTSKEYEYIRKEINRQNQHTRANWDTSVNMRNKLAYFSIK